MFQTWLHAKLFLNFTCNHAVHKFNNISLSLWYIDRRRENWPSQKSISRGPNLEWILPRRTCLFTVQLAITSLVYCLRASSRYCLQRRLSVCQSVCACMFVLHKSEKKHCWSDQCHVAIRTRCTCNLTAVMVNRRTSNWMDFGEIWPWPLTLRAVLVFRPDPTPLSERYQPTIQLMTQWVRVHISQTWGVGSIFDARRQCNALVCDIV